MFQPKYLTDLQLGWLLPSLYMAFKFRTEGQNIVEHLMHEKG